MRTTTPEMHRYFTNTDDLEANHVVDESIVYSKQTDEPRVPATVRIEWLPDGQIKPLLFWMPDGTCFEVKHLYETTKLAFLKERGVGIRIKVRGELIGTPDNDEDLLHMPNETYLYFADDFYCGANFIDERYGHAGKEYIPVTLDVFPDGSYEPIYFRVKEERYMVEKTLEVKPCGNFYAGGIGIRHKVEARLVNADDDEDPNPRESVRRSASIYLEVNKWFVRVNAA